MDDSKHEFVPVEFDTPPEREPISREDYDRLELFRHAVLQRSRFATAESVEDEDLLDDITFLREERAHYGFLRTHVGLLLGSDTDTPADLLCTELSRYKAEQHAFREQYAKLRTAACQLFTYPPTATTPGLIEGLEKLTQEKTLPLDDVDDANSLQRINSELEDEVMFLNSRLVHAIRAAHHMTALALDVACERQGGEECSHV